MIGERNLRVGRIPAEDWLNGRHVLEILDVLVIVGEVPEGWLVLDERSDGALVHDSYNLNIVSHQAGSLF